MVQRYVYSSLDSELQKPPCYTHVIQLLFDSIFDMYFIFYYNISFFMCCCFLYVGYIQDFLLSLILCYFLFLCLFLVIRIGIILSLTSLSLGFCVILFFFVCFFGIYDNIRDSFMEVSFSYIISMMIFILFVYHWLYVIMGLYIIIDL